jgi:hypothetical protein
MKMKLSLVALCLLVSFPAFAKVGDKIHRTGFFATATGSGNYTEDKEVMSYDATRQQYTVRTTSSVSGAAPTMREETVAAMSIITHEQAQYILTNCAAFNGRRESLVAGGRIFDTCAVAVNGGGCTGTSWYGDVPFGNVKVDVTCTTGTIQRLEMPSATERGGEITFIWAP